MGLPVLAPDGSKAADSERRRFQRLAERRRIVGEPLFSACDTKQRIDGNLQSGHAAADQEQRCDGNGVEMDPRKQQRPDQGNRKGSKNNVLLSPAFHIKPAGTETTP